MPNLHRLLICRGGRPTSQKGQSQNQRGNVVEHDDTKNVEDGQIASGNASVSSLPQLAPINETQRAGHLSSLQKDRLLPCWGTKKRHRPDSPGEESNCGTVADAHTDITDRGKSTECNQEKRSKDSKHKTHTKSDTGLSTNLDKPPASSSTIWLANDQAAPESDIAFFSAFENLDRSTVAQQESTGSSILDSSSDESGNWIVLNEQGKPVGLPGERQPAKELEFDLFAALERKLKATRALSDNAPPSKADMSSFGESIFTRIFPESKQEPPALKCAECNISFLTQLSLAQHNKSVHRLAVAETRNIPCLECFATFPSVRRLDRHHRAVHAEVAMDVSGGRIVDGQVDASIRMARLKRVTEREGRLGHGLRARKKHRLDSW